MQQKKLKKTKKWGITPALFLCLLAISCEPEAKTKEDPALPESESTSKVYVLNEGLYAMNNASLSLIDLKGGLSVQDIFKQINNRGLGDTGNGLKRYGNRMYAIVSASNTLEVMEIATGKSIKQIKLYDEQGRGRQPRCVDFYGSKAYVACFDGSLCKIDTLSLEIEEVIKVGRNPDGICAVNNKLYVSNSGGLDYPRYDSTLSVVSISEFKEIKKINLRINPYIVKADAFGDVYVCTRGNYEEVSTGDPKGYGFHRIDSKTDMLLETFEELAVLNFAFNKTKDTAYLYNYDYKSRAWWIKVFNLKTEELISSNFIKDGTKLQIPYGIDVDPYSGDVYISDAHNFLVSGKVYCFGSDGNLRFSRQVGVNPNSFVFVGSGE